MEKLNSEDEKFLSTIFSSKEINEIKNSDNNEELVKLKREIKEFRENPANDYSKQLDAYWENLGVKNWRETNK
jgi:hypothetical protein